MYVTDHLTPYFFSNIDTVARLVFLDDEGWGLFKVADFNRDEFLLANIGFMEMDCPGIVEKMEIGRAYTLTALPLTIHGYAYNMLSLMNYKINQRNEDGELELLAFHFTDPDMIRFHSPDRESLDWSDVDLDWNGTDNFRTRPAKC